MTTEVDGEVHVNLLYAKTKVAPLKKVSIPRLEPMAAVMLSKIMDHLKSVLQFSTAHYFYWTDSQIVLAWIRDVPHKRTVFVANRITEIQTLTSRSHWRYIDTKNNPADLGTRGISPEDLPQSNLWWKGTKCLLQFDENIVFQPDETIALPLEDNVKPKSKPIKTNIIQTFLSTHKPKLVEVSSNVIKFSMESLNKFSTLSKLVRVVAYCLRFIKKNRSQSTVVSPVEYDRALITVLRVVQEEVFKEEVESVKSDELISKKSSIHSLNPFLNNDDGLLRVSGRLENAHHLSYDQKHPIILPYTHIVSKLIARHAHVSSLHGTQQQTLMLIRQRYHIVSGKKLVKSVWYQCVRCFRHRCIAQSQLMGQIPQLRVTPNRPFLNCGVDFGGPFDLKRFRGRCQSTVKGYFAIFVCLRPRLSI